MEIQGLDPKNNVIGNFYTPQSEKKHVRIVAVNGANFIYTCIGGDCEKLYSADSTFFVLSTAGATYEVINSTELEDGTILPIGTKIHIIGRPRGEKFKMKASIGTKIVSIPLAAVIHDFTTVMAA